MMPRNTRWATGRVRAGDRANHDAYSPDGRFTKEAAETAYKVLKRSIPALRVRKSISTRRTLIRFVAKANAGNWIISRRPVSQARRSM